MSAPRQIEIFEYPAGPETPGTGWEDWAQPAVPGKEGPAGRTQEDVRRVNETRLQAEWEQRLAEEARRAFEAGRERGRQEGRQAEKELQAAADAEREGHQVRQAARLMAIFTEERDRYLEGVEREVVKLALAVAARILRREAQMDPLLLTGAVRVALGQLAATMEVRLRVPAEDLDLWAEAVKLLPNLAIKPTLVAGEGMRLGECEIETAMGSVDLGIRAQLGEIERGFFDRACAPRTPAARSSAGGKQQEREELE